MKIAFFTETYLPTLNGVSLSLNYAKEKLEKKGHEVYIFAPRVSGYKDKKSRIIRLSSVKVIDAEPAQKMVLPVPNKTFRQMLSVKLDLVHAHGGGFFSFMGYQLALAKGYPLIITYHTFVERYTHYFLNGRFVNPKMISVGSKLICNLADVVIVPSEKMRKVLLDYGVSKKIEVVPNPLDFSKFNENPKGYLHQKLGLKPDTKILVTVSRLGIEKNIDFLLRAFKLVTKKNLEVVLVIIGDGPEKKSLETLAKKLQLSDKVFFTGFINRVDMPKAYADSDIFLFASTSETQGLVIPEAAASGLPLVVVKDDAFVGAIEEGVNGFETPMKEEYFAEKVLELLQDEKKRVDFGKQSRILISTNFDPKKIIQQLLDIYQEAITIRQKKPRISARIQDRVKVFSGLFRAVKEINRVLNTRIE